MKTRTYKSRLLTKCREALLADGYKPFPEGMRSLLAPATSSVGKQFRDGFFGHRNAAQIGSPASVAHFAGRDVAEAIGKLEPEAVAQLQQHLKN